MRLALFLIVSVLLAGPVGPPRNPGLNQLLTGVDCNVPEPLLVITDGQRFAPARLTNGEMVCTVDQLGPHWRIAIDPARFTHLDMVLDTADPEGRTWKLVTRQSVVSGGVTLTPSYLHVVRNRLIQTEGDDYQVLASGSIRTSEKWDTADRVRAAAYW